MIVRAEEVRDREPIHALNTAAFETAAEANLVDTLREQARPVVSLVAEDSGTIVGHIMFSPVVVVGHAEVRVMGLAPMAVDPSHQRQGVGAALVRAGLERCRDLGFGAVVVLGHASYYPRFGFRSAASFGVRSAYEAPEEAFMLIELAPGYIHGLSGTVQFHEAFNDL